MSRGGFLDKLNAAGTVINTVQLRSQGKSISALSRQLDFNASALIHVSSQLQGMGEMSVMTLVGISELDSKLVAIGKHFHAKEVMEDTWASMRDRLIDLDDTLEEIEQQFEEFPVYSMFCLEVLEALANENGIEKENFRYRDDKVDVNAFRKRIKATKRLFNNSLREQKLITKVKVFKGLLQEYHDKTIELGKKRDKIMSHEIKLEHGGPAPKIHMFPPDPRKPGSDNFREDLDKKISDFDEAIHRHENELADLETKRKQDWSNYLENRVDAASHRFLRSIKVDLTDLSNPISHWNDGLEVELKASAWTGWDQHRVDDKRGVRCVAYMEKRDMIKSTFTRKFFTYEKCTRYVEKNLKRGVRPIGQGKKKTFCRLHNLREGAKPWKNTSWSGINEVIREENSAGEKLAGAYKATDKEISLKKVIIRDAIEGKNSSEKLVKKFETKQRYLQKFVNATEKAEELSDRLGVIENELSPHLPLDVSPSDLQS